MIEADVSAPRVFLTDRDQACMNAVTRVFLGKPAMVCRWRMNRNVQSKTRQILGQVPIEHPAPGQARYENSPETNEMMALFHVAVDSKTDRISSDLVLFFAQAMQLWRPISTCTGGSTRQRL